MFSVGARPFNSRSRQLYGGWTLAQAGNNMWGKKEFYEMAAKYAPDAEDRADARTWLNLYKRRAKNDPAFRKMVRDAGKPYWKGAVSPALTAEQSRMMWELFRDQVPFNTSKNAQVLSKMIRGAPFPNWKFMVNYPDLGAPYAAPTNAEAWATYGPKFLGAYRDIDDLGFAQRLAAVRERQQRMSADFPELGLPPPIGYELGAPVRDDGMGDAGVGQG